MTEHDIKKINPEKICGALIHEHPQSETKKFWCRIFFKCEKKRKSAYTRKESGNESFTAMTETDLKIKIKQFLAAKHKEFIIVDK